MHYYYYAKFSLLFTLFLCSMCAGLVRADTATKLVTIPKPVAGTEALYRYFSESLQSALDHTAKEYGPAVIESEEIPSNQGRQLRGLNYGKVDVVWSVTDPSRETEYLAVPFPVLGNLFSYRVLLIRKSDERFGNELTEQHLKSMTAIQGYDWPDLDIMKRNGFTVSASEYNMAFRLLENGYIDYFPRSVAEVNGELIGRNELAIAENIVLFYPNIALYFVRKQDVELQQRILIGLQRAQASGELLQRLMATDFAKATQTLIKDKDVMVLDTKVTPHTIALTEHLFVQEVARKLASPNL